MLTAARINEQLAMEIEMSNFKILGNVTSILQTDIEMKE